MGVPAVELGARLSEAAAFWESFELELSQQERGGRNTCGPKHMENWGCFNWGVVKGSPAPPSSSPMVGLLFPPQY